MKVEKKEFQPVVEECEGCKRIVNDKELGYKRCSTYLTPWVWWRDDKHCPLSDTEALSHEQVIRMAIKKNIITKDSGTFIYNRQNVGTNIDGIVRVLKRNQNMYSEIRHKLGIVKNSSQGKDRVGQQKHK